MAMINFDFTRPTEENPEGIIKVSVGHNASNFFEAKNFPLHLQHKTLSGEVYWQSDLYPGWFSQFFMNTYTTVELIDSMGNKIFEWVWDPFVHGDFAHQVFESWSLKNRGANGVAIGTHNGMTGEWVGPVNRGLLKASLVEASSPQYLELLKFYGKKPWVDCINCLITKDGSEVIFYEGGEGFTNSLSKETIGKHMDSSLITEVVKSSKSINSLISESSERGEVKWIHIDVEGMDGELIYAIDENLLPELLLFESLHMDDNYYIDLCDYLKTKGYSVVKSGWNTICTK